MNERYVVALLANVARIKVDDIAANDLQELEAGSAFPLNTSIRRGRAALLRGMDEQIAKLKQEGGLPFLHWDA